MRILAVSHASAVAVNQEPYAALLRMGNDINVIVPDRWRHELETSPRPPEVHPQLDGRVHRSRVAWPGAIQRHVHLTRPVRWIRRFRPDVVLVDEEPSSLPAAQWVRAASAQRVPVAVGAAENLDRPLPGPARVMRRSTLRRADGVFPRTPTAGQLVDQWGFRGTTRLVPLAVVVPPATSPPPPDRPFTVGFAGRLVEAKGVPDLLDAVDRLQDDTRLVIAGDGPLRSDVAANPRVDLRHRVPHADMPALYDEIDVLVLPSRTTRTWSEQVGRVLLEAMACGRPVLASASGEMPWLLSQARGGKTFPEGDVAALAELLVDVRSNPERWRALGQQGRRDVAERFSPDAAAAAFLELATELRARARQ
jgi:glycosyltransferase involved in cell wall biosynthesis